MKLIIKLVSRTLTVEVKNKIHAEKILSEYAPSHIITAYRIGSTGNRLPMNIPKHNYKSRTTCKGELCLHGILNPDYVSKIYSDKWKDLKGKERKDFIVNQNKAIKDRLQKGVSIDYPVQLMPIEEAEALYEIPIVKGTDDKGNPIPVVYTENEIDDMIIKLSAKGKATEKELDKIKKLVGQQKIEIRKLTSIELVSLSLHKGYHVSRRTRRAKRKLRIK